MFTSLSVLAMELKSSENKKKELTQVDLTDFQKSESKLKKMCSRVIKEMIKRKNYFMYNCFGTEYEELS